MFDYAETLTGRRCFGGACVPGFPHQVSAPGLHGRHLAAWGDHADACAGCGRSSRTCAATTGGRTRYGPGRTSPGRSAERPVGPAPVHRAAEPARL